MKTENQTTLHQDDEITKTVKQNSLYLKITYLNKRIEKNTYE